MVRWKSNLIIIRYIKDFGKTIKFIAEAITFGRMADSTTESINSKKKTGSESTFGLTAANTKDSGLTANSTAEEYSPTKIKNNLHNGKREKEFVL